VRITVQLTSGATRRVRGGSLPTAGRAVLSWLDHPLQPMHPGTTDPVLESFFMVDVADSDEAGRVLNRLRNDSAVQAAYVKPDDELPPA